MSVSLYYCASRATHLTTTEAADIDRIAADRQATFPYEDEDEDEENLYLYEDGGSNPDGILAGSTRMPSTYDRLMPVIGHLLDSVTRLRRVLPNAEWRVRMDDIDIPWDEERGYALPDGAPVS
ncbi:hypothetical protein [Streptomyces sp. TP-A0874]|uniref:hypothetical protein n=1 Tax=Streptomyces sp. TP-A0874 TaxID=549819 RepID=UPI000853B7DB|nr:hypothetical protein [Streptomyces sp. TP-A0874]